MQDTTTGNTLLMASIMEQEVSIANYLIRRTLTTDFSRSNRAQESALILAAKTNQPDIMKSLLYYSNVSQRDKDGNNALHHSAMSACESCVELLLETKINVNSENK